VIRKLKRALGIHFSTKALARNPDIALRQYLGRFQSFSDLVDRLSVSQPVTIVQVGANDGSSNDPLGRMIAAHPERIAKALLFEPQASAFARLSERYRELEDIVCLNAAVDRSSGTQTVFSIDRDAASTKLGRPISDGIASFDREHVVRVLAENAPSLTSAEIIALVTVQSVTVTTLADATGNVGIDNPDILLVDTEGFDAEIMSMALEAGWRPKLLQYEHKHLSPNDRRALSSHLRGLGYRLWADHSDVWGQFIS
jgi:FkbM family methyltransferase